MYAQLYGNPFWIEMFENAVRSNFLLEIHQTLDAFCDKAKGGEAKCGEARYGSRCVDMMFQWNQQARH